MSWRLSLLVSSVSTFLFLGAGEPASARVHVDVNIDVPSPFAFYAPPPVVVIPGTYVYMVPDVDVDVLFYHGYWYQPHGGRWFRAHSYDGPWAYVAPPHVPRTLVMLPPHYRSVPAGYPRIPHHELQANWGKWERNKHWNHDDGWKTGWRAHERSEGPRREHGHGRHGHHDD